MVGTISKLYTVCLHLTPPMPAATHVGSETLLNVSHASQSKEAQYAVFQQTSAFIVNFVQTGHN